MLSELSHADSGILVITCRFCPEQVDKKAVRRFLRRQKAEQGESDELIAIRFFTVLLNTARMDVEFGNISDFIAYLLAEDSADPEDSDTEADVDGVEVSVGAASEAADDSDSPKQYWKDLASLSSSSEGFLLGYVRELVYDRPFFANASIGTLHRTLRDTIKACRYLFPTPSFDGWLRDFSY